MARSRPLDSGHLSCTPCMGMVMLKGMFGHTAESSFAAFDCKRPAGIDNQVGTSTCKSLHNFISALLKRSIWSSQARAHYYRSETYVPTTMAVKLKLLISDTKVCVQLKLGPYQTNTPSSYFHFLQYNTGIRATPVFIKKKCLLARI